VERTKKVGVISAQDCIAFGVTGPCSAPAASNGTFEKPSPTPPTLDSILKCHRQNGDTYDRYLVRMAEMRQSLRIIQQAVDGIPEGPIMAKVSKY